jgi:hypothetical protein
LTDIKEFTKTVINEELEKLKQKYPKRSDSEKRRGAREGLQACLNKTEEQLKELVIQAEMALSRLPVFNPQDIDLHPHFQCIYHFKIHVEFILDTLKVAHLNNTDEPRDLSKRL